MNSNPAPNTYYLPNTRILTTTCLSAVAWWADTRCIETDKRFSTIVVLSHYVKSFETVRKFELIWNLYISRAPWFFFMHTTTYVRKDPIEWS